MPRKQLLVGIETSVLKWLVESSGWEIEEIAKRLKTSSDTINKFLEGSKKPTYRQLEELSKIFKRPVASFMLSEPKEEKPKPKDYRFIPNRINKFDKKTILVMRKARELQSLVKDLSPINVKNLKHYTTKESPSNVALKYRNLLKLDEIKQKKFKNPYDLFHYLRDTLEDLGIYVFQFSMPVDDARGFVYTDEYPNIIVVNSKDSIKARIFSLMHEFGHILLNESSIDFPNPSLSSKNEVENWCDEFASSFLLPLEVSRVIFSENKKTLTSRETLTKLSNKYKISKAMLLVNMNKLNYISNKEYKDIMSTPFEKKSTSKKGGIGIPSEVKRLNELGNKFISVVGDSYDKNKITYKDALGYLSIKSKKFDKLLAKVKK